MLIPAPLVLADLSIIPVLYWPPDKSNNPVVLDTLIPIEEKNAVLVDDNGPYIAPPLVPDRGTYKPPAAPPPPPPPPYITPFWYKLPVKLILPVTSTV